MSRLSRGVVVVGLLVGCLLLIVVTRPVWVSASMAGDSGVPVRISARGAELASVVPTAAIVVAASAAALTLARAVLRYVVLTLAGLAALGCLVSALLVALDPVSSVRGLLAEKAGVTSDSISSAAVTVNASVWPVVTVLVAALVIGWVLAATVAARSWGARAAGAQSAPAGGAESDPAAAWDALSHGDDPTT